MAIEQVAQNLYIAKESEALIQIVEKRITQFGAREDKGGEKVVKLGRDTHKIQSWGKNNLLPEEREYLVTENNIVAELISTKRGILLGSGLYAYKKRFEDGKEIKDQVEMPGEVKEWAEQTDLDGYLRKGATNLLFHANIFTEFRANRGRDKIARLGALACRHTRSGRMNSKGNVTKYFWSGNWGKSNRGSDQVAAQAIHAFDAQKIQDKSVLHTGDDLLTLDDYYFHPAWWGGKQWIVLANCIPEFHLANIKHGYNIRYHIKIPKGYFADRTSQNQTQTDLKKQLTQEAEAQKEFIEQMNDFLAGLKNSGRAVFSTYETNLQYVVGNKYPGVEIEPIKTNLQDEAMLKLFERSNQANISAQGIHPTLAAIETQGKLSSGTEIRNAFLMYVAIKTPTLRKILLEPLKHVQRINKWDPELHFGFKDLELATLDKEPTGIREGTNG